MASFSEINFWVVEAYRLKCAWEDCKKIANPRHKVQGFFLPEQDACGNKFVSDVDIRYRVTSRQITLYLCDECFDKFFNHPPLINPITFL